MSHSPAPPAAGQPLRVLYAGAAEDWPAYRTAVPAACDAAGVAVRLTDRAEDPARIDALLYAPDGPVSDFSPFSGCRLVQSLWAGVERIVGNPTLTQPLARMVDPGLREGMTEWVVGHVLRHHLGMDAHLAGQDGIWRNGVTPPLARQRRVTVLGLGELGTAAATALAGLNFRVAGWSQGPKSVPGVDCHHGAAGLADALCTAEIVVLLLPRTPQTENLMNAARLALLPRGAVLLNPGRGALIEDAALLAALDSGQVGHATLDTFRVEPLPADHPYWAHPRVTVTPHIAAATRAETAARVVAENLQRLAAGLPPLYAVDRARGY